MAPKTTVETLAVLAVLARHARTPRYGLEISQEVGLASGTIYPILARVEKAGWVESRWESIDPKIEGRRPRRYYTITAEGQRVAFEGVENSIRRLGDVPRPQWLGA